MTVFYVALGGAIGATLRYGATLALAFPFGTVTVNVLGSFAMGIAFVLFAGKAVDGAQLFLMTGVLGGFTTYSAFSLDAMKLVENGQIGGALGYVLGTVALCLGAVALGALAARSFT